MQHTVDHFIESFRLYYVVGALSKSVLSTTLSYNRTLSVIYCL
jgi:hypothetical protein